ncbi:MAG: FtsX-like permease family protein [Treponemataceae bacterium]|nr:FtsX-like permease family protein [Treponemataceae bacterium]
METLIRIALRNLSRQKKRSILLGLAIGFGIMIVTIINSIAGSFQTNVSANLAQFFSGHVFVEGVEKNERGKTAEIIRDDSAILAAIKDAGLDSRNITRRSAAAVTLIFEGTRTTQSVYGVNFEEEVLLQERLVFKQGSKENLQAPNALILSEGIAKKLKVEVGDRLLAQLKTVTGQNNVGEFVVAGIMQDMGLFSSMLAYTHRRYLNELLNIKPNEYQLFGYFVSDISRTEAIAQRLQNALKQHAPVFELPQQTTERIQASPNTTTQEGASAPEATTTDTTSPQQTTQPFMSRYAKIKQLAKTETWGGTKFRVFTINDLISQIDQIVAILKSVSLGILLVLFFIIMVGLTNTFRMIMYERIREIGTMRALGIQRRGIRNLFLLEALFLSAFGTIGGWVAAFVILNILSLFSFGTDTVFSLFLKNGHISFVVPWGEMFLHYMLIALLTLLSVYFPARKASKLEPARALRTTK